MRAIRKTTQLSFSQIGRIQLAFLACCIHACLVAQNTFSKAYDFSNVGGIEVIPGTRDFLLCQTIRYGLGYIDGFSYTRIDSVGELISTNGYSTGPLYNVMQDGDIPLVGNDGSYSFLFGNYPYNGPPKPSVRLFNVASNGEVNWNINLKFEDGDQGMDYLLPHNSFHNSPNGGYILYATRMSSYESAPILIKLNDTGEVIWNKTYHLEDSCAWKGFCEVAPNSGILIGFNSSPVCPSNHNPVLTKIGPDGLTHWSKQIEGLHGDVFACMEQNGIFTVIASDTTHFHLIKLNESGDLISSRSYSLATGHIWNGALAAGTSDGGVVLIGGINWNNSNTLLVFKVDTAGAVSWVDYFNGAEFEAPIDILEDPDGSLVEVSYASSGNYAWQFIRKIAHDGENECATSDGPDLVQSQPSFELVDVSLNELEMPLLSQSLYVNDSLPGSTIHPDELCQFFVGLAEVGNKEQISLVPNPLSNTAILDLGQDVGDAELLVYDMVGREVLRLNINAQQTTIYRGGLKSGIYFYRVVSKGLVLGGGKMIIE